MKIVEREIAGPVTILTLNDPERRNVLSQALCAELSVAIAATHADPACRMLAITGVGSSFCAGAELADLKAGAAGSTAELRNVYDSFLNVAKSPLVTVAAVNGPAVGAGINLALACDIRLTAPEARFDTRFLSIGLHPGGGHTWMMLRALNWQYVAAMALCGETLDGEGAVKAGLALRCVPRDALRESVLALGKRLKTVPLELLTDTKASMRYAIEHNLLETFEHETPKQVASLRRPPFLELVAKLESEIKQRK